MFVRFLDFNFFFLIIEWSTGPVTSASDVNTESGCFGSKIHNMSRQLIQLRFDLPTGKINGRVNSTADTFIFGWCDQVDPEWADRVTRSYNDDDPHKSTMTATLPSDAV